MLPTLANFITSLLILCALLKALATRHKPLIENFSFSIFFQGTFAAPILIEELLANVTSYSLKVQTHENNPY